MFWRLLGNSKNTKYQGVLVLEGGFFTLNIYQKGPDGSNSSLLKSYSVYSKGVSQDELIQKRKIFLVKKLLEELFSKIPPKYLHLVHLEILVGYPWIISHFEKIEINHKKPHQYSDHIAKNIYYERVKKYQKKSFNHHEYSIVEIKLIDIKLNGYRIKDPHGKYAENFSFHFYESLIRDSLKNSINLVVKKYTNPEIVLKSQDLNYIKKEKLPSKNLDIVFFKDSIGLYYYNHNLEKVQHLPGGERKFKSVVASELGVLESEIDNILAKYHSGQIDQTLAIRIESSLEIIFSSLADQIIQKISLNSKENWFAKIETQRIIMPNSLCAKFNQILKRKIETQIDKDIFFSKYLCHQENNIKN